MLRENQDRICTFFAVDYDWRLGTRLSAAVDAVCRKRDPARVALGGNSFYDFQWPDARQRVLVTPKRVGIETLGLGAWLDNLDLHLSVVDAALEALEVTLLNRVGFKVIAFLPLEMTQAESIDLMFGTFLVERDLLWPILGQGIDPLVHVEAELTGFKYALDLTTLNAEQASQWFLRLPNLDKMVDKRLLDQGVKQFHDRVTQDDSFLFDVDLCQTNVPSAKLREFATSAFDFAEMLAENCIRHLRSQPTSKFGQLVDVLLEERGITGATGPAFPPFSTRTPRK